MTDVATAKPDLGGALARIGANGSAHAPSTLDGRGIAVAASWIEFISVIAVGAAVIFAYTYAALSWRQHPTNVLAPTLIYGGALGVLAVAKRRYVNCATAPTWYAISRGVNDNLCAVAVLIVALFLLKVSDDVSRVSVLCQFAVATGLVVGLRFAWACWAQEKLADRSWSMSTAIVLADQARLTEVESSGAFFPTLENEGTRLAARLNWDGESSPAHIQSLVDTAVAYSRSGAIDSVIMLLGANSGPAERIVEGLAETPLTVYVVPPVAGGLASSGDRRVGGLPAVRIANSPLDHLSGLSKRAFDIVAASLMLFLLLPLFLGVAVAITTESHGPVFFRQTRHGYGNRHFKVFKFRSMRVMEDGKAFRQATKNDPRITQVGRFIRRTNLDELPQLLNVLFGDMSLVGPRPHPIALNDDFATRIRRFHRRHNIRPGITGWAQVNGYRGETETEEKMRGRIEHDLWYVDNWSFALDLKILSSTVFSPTAYRNAG